LKGGKKRRVEGREGGESRRDRRVEFMGLKEGRIDARGRCKI